MYDGSIPRISAKDLSVERFEREFMKPNLPVIITDITNEWPMQQEWIEEGRPNWTHLKACFG